MLYYSSAPACLHCYHQPRALGQLALRSHPTHANKRGMIHHGAAISDMNLAYTLLRLPYYCYDSKSGSD